MLLSITRSYLCLTLSPLVTDITCAWKQKVEKRNSENDASGSLFYFSQYHPPPVNAITVSFYIKALFWKADLALRREGYLGDSINSSCGGSLDRQHTKVDLLHPVAQTVRSFKLSAWSTWHSISGLQIHEMFVKGVGVMIASHTILYCLSNWDILGVQHTLVFFFFFGVI